MDSRSDVAVVDNDPVAATGKRAGSRKGARPPRTGGPGVLLLALAITACVVAWGYLVWAAIDFGTSARNGESEAWWWLALASAGAVACLFTGLLLASRIVTAVSAARRAREDEGPPPPPGGRRAAR